ncbi:hypothetical protein L218DRAFT_959113 [Marasmius fiardii PR-910]|nr:hypothetical protein L218DRAFT_959113 [Marasmius fiardii PR-910]
MASSTITLKLSFSDDSDQDLRTFKVSRVPDASSDEDVIELYRFRHPVTGFHAGTTNFQRLNSITGLYETAGEIAWLSNHNATVAFGVDEVHIRDLRKPKKSSSRLRRFKAGNSEYKWKKAENGKDLSVSVLAPRR